MSDSGRMIGECEHGYQRWHCETCKLRAVADRLAAAWEIVLSADQTIEMGQWMDNYEDVARARARKIRAMTDAKAALAEYRKAVAGG